MGAALEVLVGPEAKGLSASTVSRLKQTWAQDYRRWNERRLDQDRWVYLWADGVYSGLRAEQTKLCALVIIGVNERGEKHFLAIDDGVRESTQSWREVLLNLKSRGLNVPKLAIGDWRWRHGVLGGPGRSAPRNPPTALLDAQDYGCTRRPTSQPRPTALLLRQSTVAEPRPLDHLQIP